MKFFNKLIRDCRLKVNNCYFVTLIVKMAKYNIPNHKTKIFPKN